jgi:hypothetical protein
LGVDATSVVATGIKLGELMCVKTEVFTRDYMDDLAVKSIGSEDIHFTACRNDGHPSVKIKPKYLDWYHEKFSQYPILIHVRAVIAPEVEARTLWINIMANLDANPWIKKLYIQEKLS